MMWLCLMACALGLQLCLYLGYLLLVQLRRTALYASCVTQIHGVGRDR